MPTDDLSAPLGQEKPKRRGLSISIGMPQVLTTALALPVLVFAGWAMTANDPFGGEPFAVAPADLRAVAAASEEPAAKTATPDGPSRPNRYDGPSQGEGSPAALPPGTKTVTIIDGSSGKRQEVVIPGAADGKTAAPDEKFSEPSRHGPLPKVAQDGTRPAEAFASPAKTIPGKPDAPRIAIVVGGLGVSAGATGDALKKLPAAVTLAFAPYGSEVERQAARARGDAHELLLQVPMEPFDYPDNDAGPQTLLTSVDAGQNVDRLQRLMARMQGYVGIAGFMGGRFTASESALAPVLRETAKRGLIYFDDGGSPRSLASQIAGANNLAFAKSDVMLDSVPTAADIDRALARLEGIARDRGTAVGTAGALPVSIDRIARWAKAAEGRGFLLVPITAVVAKAKSS